MLCFFPRLRDLENCRSLGSSNNGDVSVVHVRKSFPGGAKADWYGCIFPSVGAGDLTAEFKSRFETMSNNGLYEVWNEKKDWGKSFDTLSEASSSGVVVNDCSFLLDSVSWPPLTGAKSGMKSAGWEICNVQALTEILSALRMNDAEPAAAAEGWEVLQHSPSQDDPVYVPASDVPPDFFGSPTKPVSSSAESATIATCGTVRSYRDALLKASGGPAAGDAQAEAEAERARKRVATTSAWRPAIVVQNLKYEHKDKLYQHNLVAKGIDPNAMYEEEDDGGCDGGGSFFQSSEYAKGSVSVNRMRAATMLRPAALEKKMSRIASREAQRPPVPGAGVVAGVGSAAGSSILRSSIAERNSKWSAAAAASDDEA